MSARTDVLAVWLIKRCTFMFYAQYFVHSILMCMGTMYTVASLLHNRDLSLTVGSDTVAAVDAVRVLGVLFTPDLALEKHATSVSAKCFYQLRQLRRVRRSLDRDSATILVHAFVTSL